MRLLQIAVLASLAFSFPALAQDGQLVKLQMVNFSEDRVTRQYFGRVVAKETVDLAFTVGGQINKFPIVEGEIAPKGSLLAELDLYSFKLAVEQAQLQKEQAGRTLERLEKLAGRAASQVSIDDARTAASLADVALRNAQDQLNDASLVAPYDALIVARNVPNFTSVSAGAPVVRIHDMSELRIEIEVPEVVFQRAGNDPDIEVWAKFPASEELFRVEFREFVAETSDIGQSYVITLGMAPPEGLSVFPGSTATVFATMVNEQAQAEIPASAIVTANDGSASVMVFTPGADENTGTVSRVPVMIAPSDKGAVRIVEGLENGAEIVASAASRLEDGQQVNRFTGF